MPVDSPLIYDRVKWYNSCMHLKIDQRRQEAIYLYENGTSMRSLAVKYGCNAETIKRRFIEWGVKLKPHGYWAKGVPKSPEHAAKLRANLDRQRPKAAEASKALWSTYNGKVVSRKEFLNAVREKAIAARKKVSTSGERNGRWKGGVSFSYFKQAVFARDGRKCAHCGYDQHPEIIEAHHIDGNHGNNDPANGIPLCPNCHRIEEFKRKTFHTALRRKRYA